MPTWSGMRKKLEEEYLCPALRGRVRYFVTRYRDLHDQEGRVAILLDGEEILQSSYIDWARMAFRTRSHEETINSGNFDRRHFYDAFQIYDNQSIEESLNSTNPLVRVLALMDRRLGKRRLSAMTEKMEQELPWVRIFYLLRLDAEGMTSPLTASPDFTDIQEGGRP